MTGITTSLTSQLIQCYCLAIACSVRTRITRIICQHCTHVSIPPEEDKQFLSWATCSWETEHLNMLAFHLKFCAKCKWWGINSQVGAMFISQGASHEMTGDESRYANVSCQMSFQNIKHTHSLSTRYKKAKGYVAYHLPACLQVAYIHVWKLTYPYELQMMLPYFSIISQIRLYRTQWVLTDYLRAARVDARTLVNRARALGSIYNDSYNVYIYIYTIYARA